MTTKITSDKAYEISKPLIDKELKEGDEWFAISKDWFDKFQKFAQHQIKEYPPKMDNSCLKSDKNDFEINDKLSSGEDSVDYVWIHHQLYQYFVKWFGIKQQSLTFARKVIRSNGDSRDLFIEKNPIFICCALCDCTGEPDFMSKYITSISKTSSFDKFCKKFLKKMIIMTNDKTNMITSYWYRTLMDETYKSVSIRDISNIIMIYHTVSNLAQNAGNINPENVRIWNKTSFSSVLLETEINKINQGDEHRDDNVEWSYLDRWSYMTKVENCLRKLDDVTNIDLWSDISIMFEIKYDDGKWKRKCDESTLLKALKIDIYDVAYSKWYPGYIIEFDEGKKQLKVGYDGYSSNYDEYIDINSYRIAKLHTHTSPDDFWSTLI